MEWNGKRMRMLCSSSSYKQQEMEELTKDWGQKRKGCFHRTGMAAFNCSVCFSFCSCVLLLLLPLLFLFASDVEVVGPFRPRLCFRWSHMAALLDPRVGALLQKLGYEAPTPIQAMSFPIVMSGRDVVGRAQTGSGK